MTKGHGTYIEISLKKMRSQKRSKNTPPTDDHIFLTTYKTQKNLTPPSVYTPPLKTRPRVKIFPIKRCQPSYL